MPAGALPFIHWRSPDGPRSRAFAGRFFSQILKLARVCSQECPHGPRQEDTFPFLPPPARKPHQSLPEEQRFVSRIQCAPNAGRKLTPWAYEFYTCGWNGNSIPHFMVLAIQRSLYRNTRLTPLQGVGFSVFFKLSRIPQINEFDSAVRHKPPSPDGSCRGEGGITLDFDRPISRSGFGDQEVYAR